MVHLPYSSSVRLATVKEVGRTYVDFQFLDRLANQTFRAPIPHPYAGRGGGIFAGIERDAIILVANGPGEKWYVVATIPDINFYFDLDGASDIRFDETEYPSISPGEIILKGNKGQNISLSSSGNISIDAGLGTKSTDIELSRETNALYNRSSQIYEFTEFGRAINGIVKRDISVEENDDVTNTVNFLDSEAYDRLLSEIGRHPKQETHNRTTKLVKQAIRNPALIEKRSVIYEYADSFNVKDFLSEVSASVPVERDQTSEIELLQRNISSRQNRRTDVLNLNLNNFNHLIEHVEGTVVDIYGNILDINRHPIDVPGASTLTSSGNATDNLRSIYDYHRRSVKLHYEINSRKPISSAEPQKTDLNKQNAINFSRWSIDVDAEGLTKINIPSSSNTGNIPILSRYFTSRSNDDGVDKYFVSSDTINSGAFKDEDRVDIRIKQFGPGGLSISNKDYLPDTIDDATIEVGTAWHDMTQVARNILGSSPINTSINNKIGDTAANAGGRSLHMNLDGSWELSIGADNIDNKSLMLDTKGGIISHIGSDLNGKSLVSSTDGEIVLFVGGTPVANNDQDTPEPLPGRMTIFLNRTTGDPQKITIDENGITFDVQGGMYFRSTRDIVFDAGGRVLVQGTDIGMYGAGSIDDRTVTGIERKVLHTGIPNHM